MHELARRPDGAQQEDLVRAHCAGAEEKVLGAGSAAEALTIVDELCRQFAEECRSELIVSATRMYLTRIINERWHRHDGTENRAND